MFRLARQSARLRAAAWILAGLYAIAMLGIVPSPGLLISTIGLVRSERFPCDAGGCGCASAHQCWTACCCQTTHEHLVWAITNGVAPPKGIEFTDEQWIAAANAVRPGSAHCSLCVAGIKQNLTEGIATGVVPKLQKAEKSCCTSGDEPEPESCCKTSGPTRGACPSISAASCKGLSMLLAVALPPSFSGAGVTIVTVPESEPRFSRSTANETGPTRAIETPTPPPRATA